MKAKTQSWIERITVGEDNISRIQILDTKEEGTNCPQGYEQKGGNDGFWW